MNVWLRWAGLKQRKVPMLEIKNLTLGVMVTFVGPVFVGCAFFQQLLPPDNIGCQSVSVLDSIGEGEMDAAQLHRSRHQIRKFKRSPAGS